jgi:hypothetical protein
VITTLPNRYSSFSVDALEHEQGTGISITRLAVPTHRNGKIDQAKAFLHYTRNVVRSIGNERYDLVFATSSRLMTAVLGAWVARRLRCPLYLDLRDIFVDTIKNILPPYFAFPSLIFFSRLERWAIHRASSVNLVSEGFREYFSSRYPLQRFTFFTNGVDDEFIAAAPLCESLIKRSLPLKIMYAGNLGEGQGLHAILPELAKSCKTQMHFSVFGDGGRKTQLLKLLDDLNVKNVDLKPPMQRAQLIQAYRDADVLFLHLGECDAFTKVLPSKIFEYAAMGKPIWAGVSGYSATFIQNEIENAVVFRPKDVKAALKAFEKLVIQDRPRNGFVAKYSRKAICRAMAADMLQLVTHEYI